MVDGYGEVAPGLWTGPKLEPLRRREQRRGGIGSGTVHAAVVEAAPVARSKRHTALCTTANGQRLWD